MIFAVKRVHNFSLYKFRDEIKLFKKTEVLTKMFKKILKSKFISHGVQYFLGKLENYQQKKDDYHYYNAILNWKLFTTKKKKKTITKL